jgi:hypothetical protein
VGLIASVVVDLARAGWGGPAEIVLTAVAFFVLVRRRTAQPWVVLGALAAGSVIAALGW